VFGNFGEQRSTFYCSANYIFSAFTTTGTYVIEHPLYPDYTHRLDAGTQHMHGLMMELGVRIETNSELTIVTGTGITLPVWGRNLEYGDGFSGLRHRYTPGAGFHIQDTALKFFVRMGIGR
jgi:hypothetical protein